MSDFPKDKEQIGSRRRRRALASGFAAYFLHCSAVQLHCLCRLVDITKEIDLGFLVAEGFMHLGDLQCPPSVTWLLKERR